MAEFIKTPDGRYIASDLEARFGINTFFPKQEEENGTADDGAENNVNDVKLREQENGN